MSGRIASRDRASDWKSRKTLVWNGPLGAFETPPFDAARSRWPEGRAELTGRQIDERRGRRRHRGGAGAAGVTDELTYVSTAGGAFLEWLEGRELPGVAALREPAAASWPVHAVTSRLALVIHDLPQARAALAAGDDTRDSVLDVASCARGAALAMPASDFSRAWKWRSRDFIFHRKFVDCGQDAGLVMAGSACSDCRRLVHRRGPTRWRGWRIWPGQLGGRGDRQPGCTGAVRRSGPGAGPGRSGLCRTRPGHDISSPMTKLAARHCCRAHLYRRPSSPTSTMAATSLPALQHCRAW